MLLELVLGGKKDSAHGGKIQWHLWAVMPRADTILHIGVNRMRNTQSNVQLFGETGLQYFSGYNVQLTAGTAVVPVGKLGTVEVIVYFSLKKFDSLSLIFLCIWICYFVLRFFNVIQCSGKKTASDIYDF